MKRIMLLSACRIAALNMYAQRATEMTRQIILIFKISKNMLKNTENYLQFTFIVYAFAVSLNLC